MFHGIGPAQAHVFESQLRYVAENYDVVPLATLVERATSNLRREVSLTFDDGLRNNFTVVNPILEKLNLPATFFVCPDLIDRGAWLWNHEARERLRSLSDHARTALAGEVGAPATAVEAIVEWMKALALPDRYAVDEAIRKATASFQKTPEQHTRFDLMDWTELGRLNPRLISIGSHTSSHPILSVLDEDSLEREIAGSRRQLELRLGREVPHFCYPNGSHSPTVVNCARRHYRAAVTTDAAFVRNNPDAHLLPRIPWGPSLELLAWRMWRPTA